MVRRSLAGFLWIVAGLLASFLGTLAGLVNTPAGRTLLAAVARAELAGAIGGRIEIGDAGGALLTGLTLTDVTLWDPDSTLVATLPSVEFGYRPLDLLAGRIVLRGVTLVQPYINLGQHKNGRLNIEELLHLGEPSKGPPHPATLVLLRDVRIIDGTVVLRLQARPSPGDSAVHIENAGVDGRRRVHYFDNIGAHLTSLRISSPREHGIAADVDSMGVAISDPAVRLLDFSGPVTIDGDSLQVDARRLRLPGSRLTMHGRVSWPRDSLQYDLVAHADSVTLSDLHFIDPRFPAGAVLAGDAVIRSHGPRLLEVQLAPMGLSYHGGTLTGRLTALSRTGEGVVGLREANLEATNFDLEFARPFLDTLPFAGRLTGHTTADGPTDALGLSVDWTFRDSSVAGWPVTRVRGSGTVGIMGPEGITFKPFTVDAASVDLATAHRLVPGLALRGRIDATGTLVGPYRDAAFTGTLHHQDGTSAVTIARGSLRLDARTDTLGVSADLTFDSLAFDGLRGSFPGLPLQGAAGGRVRLAGTVEALETHVDLASALGGRVTGDGTLMLLGRATGARDFTLRAEDLDLARWLTGAPPTRLSGTAAATVAADSGQPPVGTLTARIGPSVVAGALIDSAVAVARFADRRLYLDTLTIIEPELTVTGSGALGWTRPTRGTLILDLDAQSLAGLDSVLTWSTGLDAGPDSAPAPLRGSARISATLTGSLDSIAVDAEGSVEHLRARGASILSARGHAHWEPGPAPAFAADATLEQAEYGGVSVAGMRVAGRGAPDSLTWSVGGQLGASAGLQAAGRFARRTDGVHAVGFDSLALSIPGGVWSLTAPAELTFSDSTFALGALALTPADTRGRVNAQADLPRHGPASATVQIVGFPLTGLYALLERDTSGVAGAITATLGLTGTRAAPRFTGSYALTEASFGEFRTPTIDGTVNYGDRMLDGTMHLWRSGQRILNLTAHLPLNLALEPVADRQGPDTLALRAVADSVDLSLLEAATPLLRKVQGNFSADVAVGGTWASPHLSGSLRIDSAAATIPALGVRYEGVAGRLRLAGDTIRVESLSLRSDKGNAQIAGFVRLDRLTKPVLNLDITADRFKALELRGFLSVTATGRLNLTGPVFGATLTGRGTVTSGVLYFADLVNKRVVNLDSPDPWIASLIDTSLADVIRRERLGPGFESVFLDSLRIQGLQLVMGSDVWLRSDEANIQLAGTINVDKRLRNYQLSGTLQAPRGTYRLVVGPVMREFVVTHGTVSYFGTPDLDAALDISATHVVHPVAAAGRTQEPDVTVIANIGGTLLVPKLTLSAEGQDLSQTELISYLLFGQSSFELASDRSAGQGNRGVVLNNAVAVLSGAISGELERTVVSDLGVPLDYFEFQPNNPTDPFSGAQLAAGWQIGRKTFLVLNAAFCQATAVDVGNALGASLQYRFNSEWRTEVSFEPVRVCEPTVSTLYQSSGLRQAGLDFFWEKRY